MTEGRLPPAQGIVPFAECARSSQVARKSQALDKPNPGRLRTRGGAAADPCAIGATDNLRTILCTTGTGLRRARRMSPTSEADNRPAAPISGALRSGPLLGWWPATIERRVGVAAAGLLLTLLLDRRTFLGANGDVEREVVWRPA